MRYNPAGKLRICFQGLPEQLSSITTAKVQTNFYKPHEEVAKMTNEQAGEDELSVGLQHSLELLCPIARAETKTPPRHA